MSNDQVWHDPEKDPPLPRVKVLCYTSTGNYIVGWRTERYLGGKTFYKYEWNQWKAKIIAWAELPEPPIFLKRNEETQTQE